MPEEKPRLDAHTSNHWQSFIDNQRNRTIISALVPPIVPNFLYSPFEKYKLVKQLHPEASIAELSKGVFDKGVRGIFAGFWPTFWKDLLRQGYKIPLMYELPRYVNANASEELKRYPNMLNFGVALSSSSLDAAFCCPMEVIKTKRLTAPVLQGTISVAKQVMGGRNWFQGYSSVWGKLFPQWFSTIVIDEAVKTSLKDHYPHLSVHHHILISAMTSTAILSVLTTPLDVAKTHMQQHNAPKNMSLKNTISGVYQQSGWRGLIAGIGTRMYGAVIYSSCYSATKELYRGSER